MRSFTYLLGLGVVVLALYSYEVRMQQNDLEVAIRNGYTNDLASATEQLNKLQEAVSLSLIFKDDVESKAQLNNVARLSGDLRQSISQLPLDEGTTNEWLSYLKSLSGAANGARNQEEWKSQGKQYEKSLNTLKEEWVVATSNYFANEADLRQWEDDTMRQTAFQQVNTNLKTANKEDFPITASESDYRKKQSLAHLQGKDWTKQQVIDRFHELFPGLKEAVLTVSVNKDDAPYEFYHVQFAWGAQVGYADFTKKEGYLLSFIIERPTSNKIVSHEEARKAAEVFLTDLHVQDVEFIEARENHEAWHFVFSRVVDGIIVYPDTLQVKIAKDDAQVLGANLVEYVKKENIETKQLLTLQASDFFSEDVIVEEERIVVVENDAFELATCYEWVVRTVGDLPQTFKVLVDATNKRVVEIDTFS